MCTTHQRVLIQFEDPMMSTGARSAPPFCTSDIALCRSLRAPGEGFCLHGLGKPASDLPNLPDSEWRALLTGEESDHLVALLEELSVFYVPPRPAGFDGPWHILEVAAGAHTARFEWWAEPPPGWERVGAVYDYAVSLARRTYLQSLEER